MSLPAIVPGRHVAAARFFSRAVNDEEVRLNYSPSAVVRARGAFNASGAFDFTPAAQSRTPQFNWSIQLREDTIAAQGTEQSLSC